MEINVMTRERLAACVTLWLLSAVMSTGLSAAVVNSPATNCTFSNRAGQSWVLVNPLTSATAVGTVLWQRPVGLNFNYAYGGSSGSVQHELVSAGYWGPGTPLVDGIAPTNVDGIGFKIVVKSSDGTDRPILQTTSPVALEKEQVQYDTSVGQSSGSTLVTNYIQQLILTVPADQLPSGKLRVERVAGSSQLSLYAVDLEKGEATLGSAITIPTNNIPRGVCRASYLLMGPAIITMGGGEAIEVPNSCLVETYKTIPVSLGRLSIEGFPHVGSTSLPKVFNIQLSQCAANAKPIITFKDKFGTGDGAGVLGIKSSPSSAQGFGIIMTNTLTDQRIQFDSTPYVMQRLGDVANLPLTASYIRTGEDSELKAGEANGAAEFTFSFP